MKKIFCSLILLSTFIVPSPILSEEVSQEKQLNISKIEEETIFVRDFKLQGNTVFADSEFQKILNPYKGRKLSIKQLQEVATKITQKYINSGYPLSFAIAPLQEIESDIVVIQVTEARITEIVVNTNRPLNSEYIVDRLKPILNRPISDKELDETLFALILNNNLILSIPSYTIKETQNKGEIKLIIDVTPENKFKLNVRTDNYQTPFLGTNNRIVSSDILSLLKTGDRLIIGYRNNDGSNSLSGLYELPINSKDGKIRILGGNFANNIIAAPFNQPNPESDFRFFRIEAEQPLIQSIENLFLLGTSINWKQNEDFLLGERFPISRGSSQDGITTISSLSFFQRYINRGYDEEGFEISRLEFNSDFELGLGLFDDNNLIIDSQFLVWRGTGKYEFLIDPNLKFVARAGVQLATEELPGLEQFSIGGPLTIPGYRAALSFGDNGILARSDLEITIFRPKQDHSIELVPFFATGKTWNNNDLDRLSTSNLSAIGIEVKYKIERKFEATAGYAVPLNKLDTNNLTNSLQEQGFYFSVIYRVF